VDENSKNGSLLKIYDFCPWVGEGGQRVGGECQINSNQNILFTKYMNNIFLICLNEKKHKQERIHLSL
jgi:hypothetical protein